MCETLEYWRHRYRVAEAEAAHYRRKCDDYEWALRKIRNDLGSSLDQVRLLAAHTIATAGEAD